MSQVHPACWGWPIPAPAIPSELPCADASEWAWERLAEFHAGRCGACGVLVGQVGSALDHCHLTGLVRGWLCRSCNGREGRGSGAWVENYRRLPPAVIIGATCEYVGRRSGDPEMWVQVALGRLRPDDDDPVGQADFLADAANLPSKEAWFSYADEAGINYQQFGLEHPYALALRLSGLLSEGFLPLSAGHPEGANQ